MASRTGAFGAHETLAEPAAKCHAPPTGATFNADEPGPCRGRGAGPASAVGSAPAPEPQAGADVDDPGEARRPLAWEPRPQRGGFSEDAIRWLERYRGRLRHPPSE